MINVSKILAKLRQEREQIEESILSLERLARPKRGRPPAWMSARKQNAPPSGGTGSGSAGGDSSGRRSLEDGPMRKRRTPGNSNLKN